MHTAAVTLLDWLLRTTWQAAVVVALVGAVHLLVGRRLAPRWRFALWGLVVVRLLLPALPASPWSVFNFAPPEMLASRGDDAPEAPAARHLPASVTAEGPPKGVAQPIAPDDLPGAFAGMQPAAADRSHQADVPESTSPPPPTAHASSTPAATSPFDWRIPLLLAWAAGALFVTARLVIGTAVMRRRLRGAATPDVETFDLLDRCRREMRLKACPPMLVTDAVNGPALFGFLRPRLLVPPAMLQQLSTAELRFVFLHELAHLKRRDELSNAALLLAGAVHWFNPLARLAVARCRTERELACDELVMRVTAPAARPAYGRAVLRVAEWLCAARGGRPARGAAAAPMLDMAAGRSHLRRRIAMISTFRDAPRRTGRSFLPALLMFGICACALTDRKLPGAKSDAKPTTTAIATSTTTETPAPIAAERAAGVKEDTVVRQGDGEIVRIRPNGTVFINLGKGDQISPGMTFEVYDRFAGPPETDGGPDGERRAKGKASVEVVHVGPGQSECRIIRAADGPPVVERDLVCNLVYDKNKKLKFVVFGEFDLDRDRVPEPGDGDVLRRIVATWGGRLQPGVDAETDYVVLGAEPAVPKPGGNAEANERRKNALAARDEYRAIRMKAAELNVPVLNQNTFLYHVGYFEQAQAHAARTPDEAIEVLVRKSRRLSAEKRYDEAIAVIERILAIAPGHADAVAALVSTARELTGDKRYGKALAVVDRILAIDPAHEYAVGVRPLVVGRIAVLEQRARAEQGDRDDAAARPADRPDEPEAVPSAALRSKLDAVFPEVDLRRATLADALVSASELMGVTIEPDWAALEGVGLTRDARVSISVRNVKFAKVLELLLDTAGRGVVALDYEPDGDVIRVSTREALSRVTTRVYDVRDLVAQAREGDEGDAKIRQELIEEIATLIKETVDPDSWRDNDGTIGDIREREGQFIVTQTRENHRQVAALLEQLRETRRPEPPQGEAPPPPPQRRQQPAPAVALDAPVGELRASGTALGDVFDSLRRNTDQNIFINWRTLTAEKVKRDLPVTVDLTGLSLAQALAKLLEEVGGARVRLGYTVDEGVVTVSTVADLARNTLTRVYDIRNGIKGKASRDREVAAIIARIRGIDPLSWRDAGGDAGAIRELQGQLIVTQTPAVHQRIVAELSDLLPSDGDEFPLIPK